MKERILSDIVHSYVLFRVCVNIINLTTGLDLQKPWDNGSELDMDQVHHWCTCKAMLHSFIQTWKSVHICLFAH